MGMRQVMIVYIFICSVSCKQPRFERQRVILYAQEHDTSSLRIPRAAYVQRVPDARATVIICHGFMCCKDDVTFLRWLFPDCNTLIFDFRGHGEYTSGQWCTFGYDEVHEVISAITYARNDAELGSVPLIVYGFSMGAAASIRAASEHPGLFDAAIWDSPFDNTDNMLSRCIDAMQLSVGGWRFSIPGKRLLRRYIYSPLVQTYFKALLKAVQQIDAVSVATSIKRMAPDQMIQNVRIPALFISCWNDQRTPYEAVKRVYDNAIGPKELWMTEGRRHFDSFFYDPDAYAEKVNAFITQYITQFRNSSSENQMKKERV